MDKLLKRINVDTIAQAFLYLVAGWIVFALLFDVFFIYLHFTGQDDLIRTISNEITWRIDGRFK